jgi:phosphoribosylformylglycinamidine cyclo-ligase
MVEDYSKAGVDLNRISNIHKKIKEMAKGLEKGILGIGSYAGVIDYNGGKLALHVDGVGTKVLIAQMMNKYDTIGIDCVAMNVNDILCVGAKPIVLLDYIALEESNEWLVEEIMKGIIKGAEESNAFLIGGETAVLPGIIKGVEKGKGFDLSCFVLGNVDRLIKGEVSIGDKIIGLPSNGVHSNGFSLIRRVLLDKLGLKLSYKVGEETLGEELLKPTKIYLKEIEKILDLNIHGIAHITGGGYRKLRRLIKDNLSFHLEMPEPPEVFKLIMSGGVEVREMYNVFNMGFGMLIFTEDGEEVLKRVKGSVLLGEVKEGEGKIVLKVKGNEMTF